jgi:hypothetical protein
MRRRNGKLPRRTESNAGFERGKNLTWESWGRSHWEQKKKSLAGISSSDKALSASPGQSGSKHVDFLYPGQIVSSAICAV